MFAAVTVVFTATCYLVAPDGVGRVVLVAAIAVYATLIGLGPWLRGVRPAHIWIPVPVGAACLFAAMALSGSVQPGAFNGVDMICMAGYVCFFLWLLVMTCHVGRGTAARATLDAAAAGAAVTLASWTVMCLRGGPPTLDDLTPAIYPVLDVVMLGLATHLVVRLGRVVGAWWWIFGALCMLLVADSTFALVVALTHVKPPFLAVGYLITYAGLALAATHPSVGQLSVVPDSVSRAGDGVGTRTAIIGVALVLAVAAMVVPLQDSSDGTVRAVLVSLLLGLVFVRYVVATADLARVVHAGEYRATHDDLTGLPNRSAVLSDVQRRLGDDTVPETSTAVLLFGCDDLAHVNDTWGYGAGDGVLRQVAAGLAACAPADATLGRHGDSVFVLVMAVRGAHEATQVVDRVREHFSRALPVRPPHRHRLALSVGIASARAQDRLNPITLLGQATMALDDAKAHGRDRAVWFDADVEERALTRARLGAALRDAVSRDAFTLDFQPIFTGQGYETLVGWEALARWNDPGVGPVSPTVFIPLAEELGLIDDLGRLVMRRACMELASLRSVLGRDDLVVSVNASAPQLERADFADFVMATLTESGLTGASLWLEITETLLVDRGPQVVRTLEALRANGVQVCIDDFGTGYASLETLLRLPVDGVKVDRAVVARLCDGPAPRRLGHLLDLLRSMGITHLVAEGVETVEQEAAVAALGWPLVQGWLFGRPTSPSTIRAQAGRPDHDRGRVDRATSGCTAGSRGLASLR